MIETLCADYDKLPFGLIAAKNLIFIYFTKPRTLNKRTLSENIISFQLR